MYPIALSVIGITGKMGKRVLALALTDPEIALVSGCAHAHSPQLGKDLGLLVEKPPIGIFVEKDLSRSLEKAEVAIDVSIPGALEANLAQAVKLGKPLVIGTTGHPPQTSRLLAEAAEQIPLLYSPNFSMGMALCLQAASQLATQLKQPHNIEIVETHHAQKKDIPSGTALALAQRLGESVPIQSLRTGEVIGEHTVIFTCEGERIELKHAALSRDIFAQGALACAKFLSKKPPGLYSIEDLFH